MGRIRTIKPEFFLHEGLYDLEQETGMPIRVAFAGLFTQADREGRFKWMPRRLKASILPYDDVDFGAVLSALEEMGFVRRYSFEGIDYGFIPTWHSHQVINNRETESKLPQPLDASPTREPRVPEPSPTRADASRKEGKGRERKGRSTPLSDSLTEPVPWDSWISGFWKVVEDFWPKALMGNPRTAFESLVANRELWARVKADGLDWLVTIFRNMDASWKAASWPLDKYPLIANVFRSQSEHWMRHTPEAKAVSVNASAAKSGLCTIDGCDEYRHGETDLCTDHFLEADR